MLALAVAAVLPLAAIYQLSEYATFGNKFILWQHCDFAKGGPSLNHEDDNCIQFLTFPLHSRNVSYTIFFLGLV